MRARIFLKIIYISTWNFAKLNENWIKRLKITFASKCVRIHECSMQSSDDAVWMLWMILKWRKKLQCIIWIIIICFCFCHVLLNHHMFKWKFTLKNVIYEEKYFNHFCWDQSHFIDDIILTCKLLKTFIDDLFNQYWNCCLS